MSLKRSSAIQDRQVSGENTVARQMFRSATEILPLIVVAIGRIGASDQPQPVGISMRQSYLSSQTSSMRLPLNMLLTMMVSPFTCGCQQVPKLP
jgi:hypothetical protein